MDLDRCWDLSQKKGHIQVKIFMMTYLLNKKKFGFYTTKKSEKFSKTLQEAQEDNSKI